MLYAGTRSSNETTNREPVRAQDFVLRFSSNLKAFSRVQLFLCLVWLHRGGSKGGRILNFPEKSSNSKKKKNEQRVRNRIVITFRLKREGQRFFSFYACMEKFPCPSWDSGSDMTVYCLSSVCDHVYRNGLRHHHPRLLNMRKISTNNMLP